MLTNPTLERLSALKLTGIRAALEEQASRADLETMPFLDRLGLLLEREVLTPGTTASSPPGCAGHACATPTPAWRISTAAARASSPGDCSRASPPATGSARAPQRAHHRPHRRG